MAVQENDDFPNAVLRWGMRHSALLTDRVVLVDVSEQSATYFFMGGAAALTIILKSEHTFECFIRFPKFEISSLLSI